MNWRSVFFQKRFPPNGIQTLGYYPHHHHIISSNWGIKHLLDSNCYPHTASPDDHWSTYFEANIKSVQSMYSLKVRKFQNILLSQVTVTLQIRLFHKILSTVFIKIFKRHIILLMCVSRKLLWQWCSIL